MQIGFPDVGWVLKLMSFSLLLLGPTKGRLSYLMSFWLSYSTTLFYFGTLLEIKVYETEVSKNSFIANFWNWFSEPRRISFSCFFVKLLAQILPLKCSLNHMDYFIWQAATIFFTLMCVSVHHIWKWREVPTWFNNLFIIINNSTCFGHLYAHLQEY